MQALGLSFIGVQLCTPAVDCLLEIKVDLLTAREKSQRKTRKKSGRPYDKESSKVFCFLLNFRPCSVVRSSRLECIRKEGHLNAAKVFPCLVSCFAPGPFRLTSFNPQGKSSGIKPSGFVSLSLQGYSHNHKTN